MRRVIKVGLVCGPVICVEWLYRKQYCTAAEGVSPALAWKLAEGVQVSDPGTLVKLGIAERADYPITFGYFFTVGFPAMLVTVAIGTGWLLIRFL
jgi:hypothetical protein